MVQAPILKLNDGNTIPQLGLGVWQVPNGEAAQCIKEALAAGSLDAHQSSRVSRSCNG